MKIIIIFICLALLVLSGCNQIMITQKECQEKIDNVQIPLSGELTEEGCYCWIEDKVGHNEIQN